MLTTSDTRRAKASSLTKEHRARHSLAGLVGRDTRLVPISLLVFVRSRAVPQQLQQRFRQLFTARGERAAGGSEAGCKGTGRWTHPLCWFATGTPTPRNLQELWVTLLSPYVGMCKVETVWRVQTSNAPQNHVSNFSRKSRSCGGFCQPAPLSRM